MSRSRKRTSASSAAKQPRCEWDGEDSVLVYGALDDLFSFDAQWFTGAHNSKPVIFCHRYYVADEKTTTKKKHQENVLAKFNQNVQKLDTLYKELRSRMHKLWQNGRSRHTPGYIQLEYEGKQLMVQQYSPHMLRRQRPEKTLYSVEGSEYVSTELIPGDKMEHGINIVTAISLAKKLLDVVPPTPVFKTVADYNLDDELRRNGFDPDKVDEEREEEKAREEEQHKRSRQDHYKYQQYQFSGFDARPAAAAAAAAASATFASPMEHVLLEVPKFFQAREWNQISDGAKLKTRVYRMFSAVISADKCGHGPLTEDSFTRVDETVKSSGSPGLALAWGQLRSLLFLVFPKTGNTDSMLCQEIAKVVNSAVQQ